MFTNLCVEIETRVSPWGEPAARPSAPKRSVVQVAAVVFCLPAPHVWFPQISSSNDSRVALLSLSCFCFLCFLLFSVSLSLSVSLCLSISVSVCLSVSLSTSLSVSLSLSLSLSISLCLSLSVCVSVSLCLYLSLRPLDPCQTPHVHFTDDLSSAPSHTFLSPVCQGVFLFNPVCNLTRPCWI